MRSARLRHAALGALSLLPRILLWTIAAAQSAFSSHSCFLCLVPYVITEPQLPTRFSVIAFQLL